MSDVKQTLVCSKISDNQFKVLIINGFEHIEIIKSREEMESIVEYIQNILSDKHSTWTYERASKEDIKKYNSL